MRHPENPSSPRKEAPPAGMPSLPIPTAGRPTCSLLSTAVQFHPTHSWAALGALLAFHAVLQVGVVGLSLVAIPITRSLSVAIVLTGVAAGAWTACRIRVAANPVDAEHQVTAADGARFPYFISGMAVWAYLLMWFLAIITPDTSMDGNAYHIPPIHFWALRGFIHWIPDSLFWSGYMNGYPKACEAAMFVLVQASGTSAILNALNLVFLPLGVAGVTHAARLLGASPSWALAAGGLFVLIPVNVAQARSTYIDSAFGSLVTALVAVLLQGAHDSRLGKPRSLTGLFLLGAASGLVLGAKSSGLPMVAIAFALSAIHSSLTLHGWRKVTGSARTLLPAIAIAICVGGFWAGRNWWIKGSPIYPAGLTLCGRTLFPGQPLAAVLNTEWNTPPEMRPWSEARKVAWTWFQSFTRWPAPDTLCDIDARRGGLGFLWVLGGLPAALAFQLTGFRRLLSQDSRRLLRLASAFVALAFLATPMRWWARYTLWLHGLGIPAFVLWIQHLWGRHGPSDKALRTWCYGVALLALLEGFYCLAHLLRTSSTLPAGTLGRNPTAFFHPRSWDWRHWRAIPGMQGTALEQIVESEDPVALGPAPEGGAFGLSSGKERLFGQLSVPIGRRKIVCVDQSLTPRQLETLVREGVRWLIWDEAVPVPPFVARAASQAETAAGFRVFRFSRP